MKLRLHRLVVLLGVILCVAADAAAQPQFDRWTTDNGLPQGSINDIVQTRDGYLWLATFGGLVRFDGSRFVVFDTDVEGIRSQRIRALREDSEGTLWAGTEDGLLIRYRGGTFATYDVSAGLPRREMMRIDEDTEHNLWMTWAGGVVTRFDRTRAVNYRPGDLDHGVAPRQPESGFAVWWNHDSAGLHCLVNGQVRTLIVGRDLPQTTGITAVLTDGADNLLIRTREGGIIRATTGRTRSHRAVELPNAAPPDGFVESTNGDLWFSATRRDLYRLANGHVEKRATFPQIILSLYEDREGSFWVGTTYGLYRMRDVTIATHSEHDGLSSNTVYSILRTRRGAVWIGTWGGGLSKLEDGRWHVYRLPGGLPSNYITSIYEDRSERLWIGTYGGVWCFQNGRFEKYDDGHGFLNVTAWAIHQDRAGRLWFATDQGLVKLQDGRFSRFTSIDGLSHDRVAVLFEDAAGALWIGAFRGVTRLKDDVFTAFTERDGFVGNQVRVVYEDRERLLWIGTYDGGLYRFKDGRLTRYTKKQGLYDNGVFQILEDDTGNFWIGCNRGIYHISRRDLNDVAEGKKNALTSVVLGPKDGLESIEVNGGRQPSGMKSPDGHLWFPTMSGVVVIDPKAVRSNVNAPPVVIEEVRRAGEKIEFGGGVEIPPGISSFEFRYTAPSFIDPGLMTFKYMLVGLDEDWIDAHGARAAVYHRVPPGRYRFVVIAANNDGVWNTNGAGVDVVVLLPLWRRWWFVALVCAMFGSILFIAYERRVARLRRDHQLQTAFSQQLIESIERERRRISNEMHDSLGQDLIVIKTRARLTREKLAGHEAIQDELEEIGFLAEKTSAEIKDIAYDLRPYHLDKVGLSRTIEGMISRVGRTCEIEFDVRIANIDGCFAPDSNIHVFRILQEAVSNIVKHSRARRASVMIDRRGNTVEIRIEDDGKGIDAPESGAIDSLRKRFGVMGMKERARLAGGELEVRSRSDGGTLIMARFGIEERNDAS